MKPLAMLPSTPVGVPVYPKVVKKFVPAIVLVLVLAYFAKRILLTFLWLSYPLFGIALLGIGFWAWTKLSSND